MVVPADWKEVKVADVIVDSFSGPSPTCLERNIQGEEWGVFKTTCSTMEQGWDYTKHKVLPRAFWGMTRSLIEVGDTVITKAGPRHRVGVASYVNRTLDRLIVSGKMIGLRPNKTVVCPPFLALALSSKPTQEFLNQRTTGMAESQVNFENVALLETPLYLPPLKEQEAIAEALSDADVAIESLDALITKKRDVKEATMQQLLTGRARLPGFTADWEEKYLGDIARVKTGSRNNQDKFADGRYPFFVRSAYVESIDSYSYDTEAILIPGEGGIGEIFHYINGPHEVHQRVYRISDFSIDTCPKFIFFYLRSFFGSHAMRNTVKATVDSLRLPTFLEFELVIPTLKEQEAIAEALSAIDDELEVLTEQVSKLRMVKEGMMQDLLSGKVRLV